MRLKTRQKTPDFVLKDQDGREVRLSDFSGKKVALYFYPKDNTPRCTKEACSFRDNFEKIRARGIAVIGVSMDTMKSHKKFAEKYSLPFILLSNNGYVCKKYGVYGMKSIYGRKFFGIRRTTFIIDEKGKIEKIIENVSPADHAIEVISR